MFGTNKQYKQQKQNEYDGSIKIKEIFFTIQGEGPFSGIPAVFVRFGNCHLRCNFCDTDFESDLKSLIIKTIIQKINEVKNRACKFVVITGGEPFIQYGLIDLVKKLLELDFSVQIETAGNLWLDLPQHKKLSIVVSPKTSRIHPRLELDKSLIAYKFVISKSNISNFDGLTEYTPTKTKQLLARPQRTDLPIYIQPCDEYDLQKNKTNLECVKQLALKYNYRASIQLHKLLKIE